MIKLTSFGAAESVTGSMHMVSFGDEENSVKILLDAGAFQGLEAQELNSHLPRSISPMEIKYIFITHGHYDHIGRLPMLVQRGFHGKIISTPVTRDIAFIVPDDMMKVQRIKQEEKNANTENVGISSFEQDRDLGLLFTEKDIENVCECKRLRQM